MPLSYPHAPWNETQQAYPRDETLVSLFEQQAARWPDAIALRCADEALSYAALNERANRLAHGLVARGAQPGGIVSVSVPRSIDMVVALLAVMKTGAAYLPLDPAYPAQRLAYMLADSGSTLGIVAEARAASDAGRVVSFVTDAAWLAQQPGSNPPRAAEAQGRAYVIYTSGSTGNPKGVQIRHTSVVNFLHAMQATLRPARGDVFLALASMSFDMSVLDMYLPLCFGATLAVATREVAADPLRLRAELDRSGATFMQATPAHWKMLLDSGFAGNTRLTALVGGDALPEDLAEALRARVGTVWNLYGPTETTVYSTIARYRGGKPLIGRPIANTQIYLLDADLNPVAPGEAGELHIGGDGLALGYLNREALTAEKFVADPFSAAPARMYKTGDLARYTESGDIECLGRIDRQVKIRGYRIELGEVEAVLRLHPDVVDACVIDQRDDTGEKSLLAYYVRHGQTLSGTSLRAHAMTRLPEFMVPTRFVRLEALPLSPNGKIDRHALPAPDSAQDPAPTAHDAPRDAAEEAVATIWCAAFRRRHIGRQENFFEIGGHSLMAVRLTKRLEEHFATVVPLDALWTEGSTIEGMARMIQRRRERQVAASRLVTLQRGDGTGRAPLFVMHTLRGSVNEYHAFASHVAAERPVIGVRSRGLVDDDPPPSTIAGFARDAVDAILEQYPDGPYCLAGYSIGGLIAYEAAVLLAGRGHRIDFLGLFDTPAPGYVPVQPEEPALKAQWNLLRKRARRKLEPVRELIGSLTMSNAIGVGGTHPSQVSEHSMALFRALAKAEPQHVASAQILVQVDLFLAQDAARREPGTTLGWDEYALAGVRRHFVAAGHHFDMMKAEYSAQLAALVNACLGSGDLPHAPDATRIDAPAENAEDHSQEREAADTMY